MILDKLIGSIASVSDIGSCIGSGSGTLGPGGQGGGGDGADVPQGNQAQDGQANTGGGGGGTSSPGHEASGGGGSGIVIIAYPNTFADLTNIERACLIGAFVFFLLTLFCACLIYFCLMRHAKKRRFKSMVQAVREDILGDDSSDDHNDSNDDSNDDDNNNEDKRDVL